MRILPFFGLLVTVILLTACKKEFFALNEEVAIGFNASIVVQTTDEKLELKFVELIEESRCPPGATCVWAGFVKVKIKLNNSQFAELGLGESISDSMVFNNHVIRLLEVTYDTDNDFGVEKKSSIVIRVD